MGGGGSKGADKKKKSKGGGCFSKAKEEDAESNMDRYRKTLVERSSEEATQMIQEGRSRKEVKGHLKHKGLTAEEVNDVIGSLPETHPPLQPNQRVEVNYSRDNVWYPATYRGPDPKGRREFVGVEYDDRPGTAYGVYRRDVRPAQGETRHPPRPDPSTQPEPEGAPTPPPVPKHKETLNTYIRNRHKRDNIRSLHWDDKNYHTHGTYQDEIRRLRQDYKKGFQPTYPTVEAAKKFFKQENRYLPVSDKELVSVMESVPRRSNDATRIEFNKFLQTLFRFLVKPVEIVESLTKAIHYFEAKDKLKTLVITEQEMRRLMDPWSEYFGEREIRQWFNELKCDKEGVLAYHESVEAAISKVIEQDARDEMHKHVDDGLVPLSVVHGICQRWDGYMDFQGICEETGVALGAGVDDSDEWIRRLDMDRQVDYRDTIGAMHDQFAAREEDNFIQALETLRFRRDMVEILMDQQNNNGTAVVRALVVNRRTVRDIAMHSDHEGARSESVQKPGQSDPLVLDPITPRTQTRRDLAQTPPRVTRRRSDNSYGSVPIPEGARARPLYDQRAITEPIHNNEYSPSSNV